MIGANRIAAEELQAERVQREVQWRGEETGQERQSLNGGPATGSRWEGAKGRFEQRAPIGND